MIQRKITGELLRLLKFFPAVGIIGPRQCGKTTLAKLIIERIPKDCIYLDMESYSDIAKLEEPELFFLENQSKCIILDEIQRKSELFPLLRSVIDRNRVPGRFILLGSANPSIMRDASESLAGRIAYKELTPIRIVEAGFENINKHWLNGGFPEVFLSKDDSFPKLWLENYVQTYIERDLPQLGLQVSPLIIRNLWKMIAHCHGDVMNSENFARSMGISSPTVKKYIHFLEEAFLISTLPPFHVNTKKRLIKSPKLYIRDSGILHYLTGTLDFNDLLGNVIIGASWEGYVIEQIRNELPGSITPYFYRTHQGTECDLILAKGIKPVIAIEVKFSSTPKKTKSFTTAMLDLNTKNNFIVIPDDNDYPLDENIRVCGLKVFLNQYLPELIR